MEHKYNFFTHISIMGFLFWVGGDYGDVWAYGFSSSS